MTQYQLILAGPALTNLSTMRLPVKTAYAIYKLNKKSNSLKDFFLEEEQKMIKEFNGQVQSNGQIFFEDSEKAQQFSQKYSELKGLEAEDVTALQIKMADLGDQLVTAADIQALDGVIEFTE